MKAVSYEKYGGRDVLQLVDTDKPAPEPGEVLVRVQAASINPVDGKVRRGELKLIAGGKFPKRPGLDFAGVVETVGDGVSAFSVGDAVYGGSKSMSVGTLAEHVVVKQGSIARRPKSLGPVAAAAVPVVAIGALQSLRDTARVQPGDHVLVNGCTGGVGIFAVQLAKRIGAHVTGVCGTEGVDLARQLGADEIIDYRKQSVATTSGRYHVLLELSGRLPFDQASSLLDDRGLYVDFSPSPASLLGNTLANPFRSHKHVFVMSAAKTADLEELGKHIDAGQLRLPPIKEFPLDQYREAFDLAERGGFMGKVVVRIS